MYKQKKITIRKRETIIHHQIFDNITQLKSTYILILLALILIGSNMAARNNIEFQYVKKGTTKGARNINTQVKADILVLDDRARINLLYICTDPIVEQLERFYNRFNGDQWTTKTGWLDNCDPCNGNNGGPWFGLTCNNQNQITKIILPDNNLEGVFYEASTISLPSPPDVDFSLFEKLEVLDLNSNNISSGCHLITSCSTGIMSLAFHASITAIPSLRRLILRSNPLDGILPSTIGNMTNLEVLGLKNTMLGGYIPRSIGELSNLERLILSDNQLTGTLPYELGMLNNLVQLTLQNNNLKGCIPSSYSAFCGIGNRNLDNNPQMPYGFDEFCVDGIGTCDHDCSYIVHKNEVCASTGGAIPCTLSPLVQAESEIHIDGHYAVRNNQLVTLTALDHISFNEEFEVESGSALSIINEDCRYQNTFTQYPIPTNADFEEIEGQRMYVNPQIIENMRIVVCGEHFPIGSQGYQNVENIVDFFNGISYIKPKFRSQIQLTSTHIDESELYLCGNDLHPIFDDNDIYICIVDSTFDSDGCGIGDSLSSTAAVAKYVSDSEEWRCCTNIDGESFDKAVLQLRKSNYGAYFNNSNNLSASPSTGIMTHEIGHMLHMGHYGRNGNAGQEKREKYFQIFDGLCNGVGNFPAETGPSSEHFHHQLDFRRPRMTAYTRAIFDWLYPLPSQVEDVRYEWTIHEVLTFRNDAGNVTSNDPETIRAFYLVNPQSLIWTGTDLIDESSGLAPEFNLQFSNPSNKLVSTSSSIKIRILLRDLLGNEVVLIDADCPIEYDGIYTQIHFNGKTGHFAQGTFDALSGGTYFLRYEIDSDNSFIEFDESNNTLDRVVDFRNE